MLLGLIIDLVLFAGLWGTLSLLSQRRGSTLGWRLATAWVPALGVYLAATLAFFGALWGTEVIPARVEPVPGFPAERAGVRAGDLVLSVDGEPVHEFADLRELNERLPLLTMSGSPTSGRRLELDRSGLRVTLSVEPNPEGALGLKPTGPRLALSAGPALAKAFPIPLRNIWTAVRVLGDLLQPGPALRPVGGPVVLRAALGEEGPRRVLSTLGASASLVWPLTVLASAVLTALALARPEERRPR